ncbi:MAG: hypothetical protein Q8Q09_20975 [Deltaproteobacteria bacterium]|nr:hypothetical protein [Deltaproteobacteria bacterium]
MNLELGWEGLGRIIRSKDKSRSIEAQDEIHVDVRMLPILSEAEMKEILQRVLESEGWTQNADGTLSKEIGDATATLSPESDKIVLAARQQETVKVTEQRSFEKDTTDTEVEATLDQGADAKLDALAKAREEALSRQAVARLLAAEPTLRETVQTALNKVYREALEQRAKQLGAVERIREEGTPDGNYEVTIVVRG